MALNEAEPAYPAIEDYAVIGDTRTVALVSRQGSIDWLCLPDFDSPSLCARVLDRLNGGSLGVRPAADADVSRRYVGEAPVLETRFETAEGVLRVTDFMPLIEGAAEGLEPERQLLRIVEVESGSVEVDLVVDPRPGYGRAAPDIRDGPLGWTFSLGSDVYLLRTDMPLSPHVTGGLVGRARLEAGAKRYMSLSYTGRDIGIIPVLAGETERKLELTQHWWKGWEDAIDYDGPYLDQVKRSALMLRLLSFTQSGAVVAAPTMSLPEAIGGKRNWDYRYCWLRDASYILQSYTGLGLTKEAGAFFEWLIHATRLTRPSLATLYDLYGRTGLTESTVRQFEGYRGSGPVNLGNAASSQFQLDVYGSVITAVDHYVQKGGTIQRDEKRVLRLFGEKVCEVWRQPDDGIWEFRGPRMHTTYSKVMCWAALDRLLALASRGVLEVPEALFRREAEALREIILRDAWNDRRQAFTGAFGHDFLDASVLTMPRLGFIDPNDERMRKTYDRIIESLGRGSLVYRYEEGSDAFTSHEGTFGVCAFWAAEYLALRGETGAARERFEDLMGYASDLGIYAEEIDEKSGAALGNYPQALTHTGVINAALTIAAAERKGKRAA